MHEKSILFALLPAALLLPSSSEAAALTFILSQLALSSMFPLLRRDGLFIPWVSLQIIWWSFMQLVSTATAVATAKRWRRAMWLSLICPFCLHIVEAFIAPPRRFKSPLRCRHNEPLSMFTLAFEHFRFPDLHVLLLMILCAGFFSIVLLASNALQLRASWELGKTWQRAKQN